MPYSENALNVYKKLYFRPGDDDDPHRVHARVAKFAACGDVELESRLTKWMDEGYMRPNTPTLMNAGYLPEPQTSACFLGLLDDDLTSILNFQREAGLIYNKGSGIGGVYGSLREAGASLSKSGGTSSGPISFLINSVLLGTTIKSGGRRRAAHMGMMKDWHPDLIDWINLKANDRYRIVIDGKDSPLFEGVNLSIAASNDFMEAAIAGRMWELRGVVDNEVKKIVNAAETLDLMATNACKCGDPGIWFVDRANEDNTLPSLGRLEGTNPCSEQHLLPRQSCALASINLAKFVAEGGFNWYEFGRCIFDTTTMQDNLIDISGYPTSEYRDMALKSRPIGIGMMGMADVLLLMGIPYDSKVGADWAGKFARFLTSRAIRCSVELARQKGPFNYFDDNHDRVLEVASKFVKYDVLEDIKRYGLRNSQFTTLAPTGSVSISCDCSPGMEPLFAITYGKRLADSGEVWQFANPIFERLYSKEPWYAKAIQEISDNHGSCRGCPSVPVDVQNLFVTAHDINWRDRIAIQAALQSGISNGISSTINLPAGTSPETVKQIYIEAWRAGLKGITVYVDGCKSNQPVVFGGEKKEEVKPVEKERLKPLDIAPLKRGEIVERPKVLDGSTFCYRTGCGKTYISVNHLAGEIMEAFANPSAGGGCQALIRGLSTIVSMAIRGGLDPALIACKLNKIICPSCRGKEVDVKSCPAAIAKAIMEFSREHDDWDDGSADEFLDEIEDPTPLEWREAMHNMDGHEIDAGLLTVHDACSDSIHCTPVKNPCPDCGAELMPAEGCFTCRVCGFSKCS